MNRFTVTFSQAKPYWFMRVNFAYHDQLKNLIKGIPGSRWDGASKSWLVPVECEPIVRQYAVKYGAEVVGIEPPDQGVFCPDIYIPEALHPFQQNAILQALALPPPKRWIFNAEMGLGKTPMAITTMKFMAASRILIVCPAVVRQNWKREFDKWWPEHGEIGVINVGKSRTKGLSKAKLAGKDAAFEAPIQVVSYSLLDHIEDGPWDVVVFDEAHRLKSAGSKQTKQAMRLVGTNPRAHVLGLTATLLPDRPTDAFGPLNVIWPGRFGRLDKTGRGSFTFNQRYSVGQHNGYGWKFSGVNELYKDELRARLAAVSSRTTKAEVAHLLPAYDVHPLYVQGGDRLEHTAEWVEEAVQSASHVCVLTHLRSTAHTLRKQLAEKFPDHHMVHIDGGMSPDARNDAITEASVAPKSLLVATMHSVGIGIDLTAFTQCLFAELYWRPETIIQGLGRFSRLSGKIPSSVSLLVIEGTKDEVVAAKLQEKIEAINEAVKAGRTEADLETMLLSSAQSDEDFVLSLLVENSEEEVSLLQELE